MITLTMIVLSVCMIAVTYVFLVMPRATDGADMDLQRTDYADGGLHSPRCPVGSFDAIKAARNHGYGVKIDIAISRDGKLFAVGYRDISKACGTKAQLETLSSSDIKKLRLCNTGYGILPLSEVFTLIDGNVPILIEIRENQYALRICRKLCTLTDGYAGAFAIQSTSPQVLAFFKKYRPRYARGQVISCNSGKGFTRFVRKHMFTNVYARPDFVTTPHKMVSEPAFLLTTKLFRKTGFIKGVRDVQQYDSCRTRGLYAIFCNIEP